MRVGGPDECWTWIGAIDPDTGYGKIGDSGRTRQAHRVSYTIANGAIPDGLQINHHCDVRRCVNPRHLYAGTAKDNTRDCIDRGRWRAPWMNAT